MTLIDPIQLTDHLHEPTPTSAAPSPPMLTALQRGWFPRIRAGAVAELRHMSHERIAAVAGNPTIDAGSKVEIQDLHWDGGVLWVAVVVVESAKPGQVGVCACMPVGWLMVEVTR